MNFYMPLEIESVQLVFHSGSTRYLVIGFMPYLEFRKENIKISSRSN